MNYTDGNIEDKIISFLSENGEKNIIGIDNDGALFHNFTNARENILNWYPFKKNDKILEIGAGMGALTNMLSDKCEKVIAVEMSPKRAKIIELRCKDKKNVQIINNNIQEILLEEKFDYVLLIGVLEYAEIITSHKDAFLELIKKAKSFLKEDTGRLLIAIENKFGLKYWCGASEDHTNIPFDSINDYKKENIVSTYGKKGVRTFSKNELTSLIKNSGFSNFKYYYPLPDYKFPIAIFTDYGLPTEKDIKRIKFTYPLESELIADERKLYPEIINNGVFPFFSNSFLIEASNIEEFNNIRKIYHKRDYKDEYKQTTIIYEDKVIKFPNKISSKEHLENSYKYLDELSKKGIDIVEFDIEKDYYKNKMLFCSEANDKFIEYIRSNNLIAVLKIIDCLKNSILKSSNIININISDIHKKLQLESNIYLGDILEFGYIDMTFQNSFYYNEELIFFDQEWKIKNIPINFILYRAIIYAYEKNEKISIKTLFDYCEINEKTIEFYDKYEKILLDSMMDKTNCSVFDANLFHGGLTMEFKNKSKFNNLENHINQLILQERNLKETINNNIIEINKITKSKEEIERLNIKNIEEIERLNIKNIKEIENKNKELFSKQEEIERLNIKNEEEINSKNEKINYLETELNNKKGHIELLLESDRELKNIKSRWRWRIVNFPFYITKKVAKKLLPKGSKGYLFGKLFMNSLRNPKLYISKLNPKNIKKLFNMISNEGSQRTIDKLSQFDEFNKNIQKDVKIEILDIENITYEKIIVPKFDEIEVSIIIPVYNQFNYTYNCIKSIVENTNEISYEIIIVDDVSSDKTMYIKDIIKGIKLIRNDKNLGFLLNCNNASKLAIGRYLYFLNNDTNIQKNSIESLVKTFEMFEKVGLVGSKLVYPDGKLQEAGGILWKDASAWNYGNRSNPEMSEYNYTKETDYVSGASMMIIKSLWDEIGGFDLRYVPAYCEDSDLAFEVRKRNYKVVYQPKSIVVHFEGVSNGTNVNSGIKAYQIENQKKFYEKWKKTLEKEHFPNGENVFKARDRSFNKKTILVIDHYVPHYDKDAGSRTIYQYLQLFIKMGLKVKFIGDNYFKHEPYTTMLQNIGVEVLYGTYYANNWKEWIKLNSQYIDYVFLNRPHITIKYIDYIKNNTNAKIFYYGHDLHFLREKREYELKKNPNSLKKYHEMKEVEFDIMSKSDFVYYPSYIEVEEINKYEKNINVKAIQAYIYENVEIKEYNIENRNDILFVGGFNHTPNVDAMIWFVNEIFPYVLKKYPDIKLNIIGSNPTKEIMDLKSENVDVTGYVTDEELEKYYLQSRLIVVPLRYGAGIKGKVIEAMTKGVPIITTTIGAEGINYSEELFLISDNVETFAQNINEYYDNEIFLKKISKKYFDYIKKYFSYEHALEIIKSDFNFE